MAITNTSLKSMPKWRHFPAINTLDYPIAAQIDSLVHLKTLDKGTQFFLDQNSRRAFFVLEGMTKLIRYNAASGKEVILHILGAGDIFGIPFAVPPGKSTAVVALQDCTLGYMEAQDFKTVLQAAPELGLIFNRAIEAKLSSIESRLEELFFRRIDHRLASLLLRLAAQYPARKITLPQKDLASLIGATRERVNQVLSEFKRRGWIKIAKKHIALLDRAAIEQMAASA